MERVSIVPLRHSVIIFYHPYGMTETFIEIIIVLSQVLSTTRLVLITSCIDQNLSTIRSPVANYKCYTDAL